MVLIIVPCTVVEQTNTEESQGKGDKKHREWRLPQMPFLRRFGHEGIAPVAGEPVPARDDPGILLQLRSGLWALFSLQRQTNRDDARFTTAKGRWIGSAANGPHNM